MLPKRFKIKKGNFLLKYNTENVELIKSLIIDRLDLALCSKKYEDAYMAVYMYFKTYKDCQEVADDRIILAILETVSLSILNNEDIDKVIVELKIDSDWKVILLNKKPVSYYVSIRISEIDKQKIEMRRLEEVKKAASKEIKDMPRKRGRPRKNFDNLSAEA